MLISKHFENQEIFITGGSGFIGKALIEKLLRSCPGVAKIYVLIRGKNNKSAEERLRDILSSALFDNLRATQPSSLNKVCAIEGDCSEIGLAIKPHDLKKLQNVNTIFHSAASVRFDDHLRDAILLNTRGTLEMVKLAEQMKHLSSFVHVSTTYCNPHMHVVEEKVYPSFADWRTTIKLAETYNTQLLNTVDKKYGNNQPNTYTFTKSLSEQIVNEYMDKLPIIIFRPSIVISSISEPLPGWMDNFNGPVGLLVACGVGIIRTNYGDPNISNDFVPVDIVVRGMIVAAHHTAMVSKQHDVENKISVVNCSTGRECPICLGRIVELGKPLILENPFEKTLWAAGGSITKCRTWHIIRFITLHILMALLVDGVLRLSNLKPFLLKIQRRIFAANIALHYFMSNSWSFKNENLYILHKTVSPKEIETFGFMQHINIDYEVFFRQCIRGAKMFLLNEPAESSKGARFRVKIFQTIDFFVKFIVGLLFVRFLIRFVYFKFFWH